MHQQEGMATQESDPWSNLMDRLTGKEAVYTSTSGIHILELIDQK
jgi:hypothetical protein